jgi:ATP-dependent helicase/DNAse subunit B
MDDSSFPSPVAENFIYSKQFSRRMKEHHVLEEPLLFYMSTRNAEKLIFTFPRLDNENSDNALSPYLREIMEGIRKWSEPVLHRAVPGAAWEGKPTSKRARGESAIRNLRRSLKDENAIMSGISKYDEKFYNSLSNAIRRWIKRSETDGAVLEHNTGWNTPDHNRGLYWITELEKYISCPVAYFYSKILGLDPDKQSDDHIDRKYKGIIIHDILAEFYLRRKQIYGSAKFGLKEIDENKNLIRDIAEKSIKKYLDKLSILPPLVLLSEKKFITGWMESFVEKEAEYFESSRFEPAMFEVKFGHGDDLSPPPLKIEYDGKCIHLSGRIDRIDQDNSSGISSVRVIDYKTGRAGGLNEIREGKALQVPFYLKAAAEMFFPGYTPDGGTYYSLKGMKMLDMKLSKTEEKTETWDELIGIACSKAIWAAGKIREGLFTNENVKCGESCEFIQLCREKQSIPEIEEDAAE